MTAMHTGSCFCGAVEIEVTGAPEEMGYCHCGSCRSYSGGPVSAFTLWKSENVKVTKGAEFLGRFKKTEMSERRFCTRCGGHIATFARFCSRCRHRSWPPPSSGSSPAPGGARAPSPPTVATARRALRTTCTTSACGPSSSRARADPARPDRPPNTDRRSARR